jgi:hypothetical protein
VANSGAQPGNQNARKAKLWEQALKRALARSSGSTVDAGLDKIADIVVTNALNNDARSIDEIGNRMDGKPAQSIGGDPDAPPVKIDGWLNFVKP